MYEFVLFSVYEKEWFWSVFLYFCINSMVFILMVMEMLFFFFRVKFRFMILFLCMNGLMCLVKLNLEIILLRVIINYWVIEEIGFWRVILIVCIFSWLFRFVVVMVCVKFLVVMLVWDKIVLLVLLKIFKLMLFLLI